MVRIDSVNVKGEVAWTPVLDIGGKRYPITKGRTIIGRGSEADVTVDDTGTSRKHVEILWDGTRGQVNDLGSTNGSKLNGQPLKQAPLPPDSRHRDRAHAYRVPRAGAGRRRLAGETLMGELTLLLLRLGFLVLLWAFVFAIVYALRSDLFGQRARRLPAAGGRELPAPRAGRGIRPRRRRPGHRADRAPRTAARRRRPPRRASSSPAARARASRSTCRASS